MSYDSEKVSVPRIAHLVKGDKGYGFNLHGDKNQPGQTISAVDKDSPAELGGLREGDRVIEVNGDNVENKTHGEVVTLIKKRANETSLLVCDKDTLAYLKANNRPCTADMANLSSVIPTEVQEPAQPMANGNATPDVVQEKIEESAPAAVEESTPPPPEPVTKVEDHEAAPVADTTPEEVKQLNNVLDEQEKPAEQPEPTPEPPAVQVEQPAEPDKPVESTESEPEKPAENTDGLKFDMDSARPKGNKRKSAKSSGEAWSNKVSLINSM